MITRKNTAAAMLPRITRRRDIGICFPSVKLYDYDKDFITRVENSISWTIMDNNKLIRENHEEFVKMCDETIILRKENATEEFETKSFSETSRIKPTINLIQVDYSSTKYQLSCVLLNGIWAKYENAKLTVYSRKYDAEDSEEKYVNLLTQERVDKSVIDESCIHYSCLGNSPSGERRQMILCGSDNINWNGMIDKASDGFLTLNKGEKTYKEMAKQSAKLFQCLAGSVSLGTCNHIAIYFQKFSDDKFDGMCYGSSESLAEHISETKKISIHPGALNGMFIQGRIAQGKYGYITLPDNMIRRKMNYLSKRENKDIVHFSWEDVKEHVNELAEGKYNGHVVTIGDEDKPLDILMDSNTLKSIYDFSKKPEYTVLRILKNNSEVHFSSTIFAKLVTKNPEMAYKIANKLFQYDMINTSRRQLKETGRVLGLDTFDTENIFMRDVLVGAFPEYVRQDKNVAFDCIKNVVEGANKKTLKLGTKIRGSGKGIVVGPENLSQKCILGEYEMYNRHLYKMFRDLDIPEEHMWVAGYKYPTMDVDEYENYNLKSLDTIKDRLKQTIRSEGLRKTIEHEYFMYQDSIAVMPCTESFKEKHAGSDFDTDMIQFIMLIDDDALEIIKEKHPELYDEMVVYNWLYHIHQHETTIVKICQ